MMIDREVFRNKLLFWDIETSFMEVYTHYIGSKVSISHSQIKRDKKIICISYKAEGWSSAKTLYWDENQDDKEMLEDFVHIAKRFPVLVGQNADAFDLKTFKGRLWQTGASPLTNILTLDTLKMSRQNFKLPSHKLDYKAKTIGGQGKIPMYMEDWIAVQEGNREALAKMGRYNRVDVDETQEVFWSMLPYVDKLPVALGVMINGNRDGCPKCSNYDIIKNGVRPSPAGLKQRYTCKGCGHDWTDTRLKRD